MARKKTPQRKKYFTVAEANAMLPLVRAIVKDITDLFPGLRERHERLQRILHVSGDLLTQAHREEVEHLQAELQRGQERMGEFLAELNRLGVELKDPFTGLVDFPCWMDDREVYLCWRLDEPEVAHWHELNAGFAGRKQIQKQTV